MDRPTATAHLLEQINAILGDDLRAVEEVYADELASHEPYVQDVLAHLARYRGKRLRPILHLLCGRATGRVTENHHKLAAVVEMIHTATLVHDDVLDDADVRRHVATIHTRWNTETSVLLGDYLFTHAFHLASRTGSAEACRLIGDATNRVCEGELCQVHHRGNLDLTEDEYLRILDGKTAALTAVSCELGSRFAGGSDEQNRELRDYGRCLGIAFQIADDLLDLLGDQAEVGKTLGCDLEKQKLTLPVIRLLDRLPSDEKLAWQRRLAAPDEQTARDLREALLASDALEYARDRATHFVEQAKSALGCLPESQAKQLLATIAEFSMSRSY